MMSNANHLAKSRNLLSACATAAFAEINAPEK